MQGLNDKADTSYYMGKRVAYIFKAKTMQNNSRYRVRWGKIINAHGNAGVVRASFKKNLPPQAMGSMVRVMLYPQRA